MCEMAGHTAKAAVLSSKSRNIKAIKSKGKSGENGKSAESVVFSISTPCMSVYVAQPIASCAQTQHVSKIYRPIKIYLGKEKSVARNSFDFHYLYETVVRRVINIFRKICLMLFSRRNRELLCPHIVHPSCALNQFYWFFTLVPVVFGVNVSPNCRSQISCNSNLIAGNGIKCRVINAIVICNVFKRFKWCRRWIPFTSDST